MMRILFINHTFPGLFGALASAFAAGGHEVLFASGFRRREFSLPGVRHIVLAPPKESRASGASRNAPGLEAAFSAGGQAVKAFSRLAEMGLAPDMVLSSASDGYGLFCEEAFPRAFRVGWAEAPVRFPGREMLGETAFTRQLLQCRYAVSCHAFVCLGTGEPGRFASSLAHGLDAPYAVNTEWFSPGAGMGPEVVLLHAGRLDAALVQPVVAGLLEARGSCHVAVLCEGRAAWESWSAARAAMPQQARLHLPGTLSLEEYRQLLRAAALLVCPHDGLPASTLLEAMSCGAVPVLEEDRHPVFLHQGQNAFFYQGRLTADLLVSLLEAHTPLAAARAGARAAVLALFDGRTVTLQHMRLLLDAYGAWKRRSVFATPRQAE